MSQLYVNYFDFLENGDGFDEKVRQEVEEVPQVKAQLDKARRLRYQKMLHKSKCEGALPGWPSSLLHCPGCVDMAMQRAELAALTNLFSQCYGRLEKLRAKETAKREQYRSSYNDVTDENEL